MHALDQLIFCSDNFVPSILSNMYQLSRTLRITLPRADVTRRVITTLRAYGTENGESKSSPTEGVVPDGLAQGEALGRTGGGKPLDSSHAPPPQPKIYNASVHGGTAELTKEQQAEVDAHNREFEAKHGRGQAAATDKVDKSFWSGKGSRTNNA